MFFLLCDFKYVRNIELLDGFQTTIESEELSGGRGRVMAERSK